MPNSESQTEERDSAVVAQAYGQDGSRESRTKHEAPAHEEHHSDRCPRMHVVLVPGFGGFDALGQVNYYMGTTESATRWRGRRKGDPRASHVVLHYFDNLPTAAVNTRAERLMQFLLDRCERNEFREGDSIALIGHSTGGLDVRRVLCELFSIHHPPVWETFIDAPDAVKSRLRHMIARVVFMSVPQRGTNIANWARRLMIPRMLLVGSLRRWYDAIDLPLLETLEAGLWRRLQVLRLEAPTEFQRRFDALTPDLYAAVMDVNTEAAQRVDSDPIRAAKGREALSQLGLYLNQTHGDFLAIEDLAAPDPTHFSISRLLKHLIHPEARQSDGAELATLDAAGRQRELDVWERKGIKVLSFATFAPPPSPQVPQVDNERLRWLYPLWQLVPRPWKKSDGPFRLAYTACEAGPFAKYGRNIGAGEPDMLGEGSDLLNARTTAYAPLDDGNPNRLYVRSWENDAIVNTASMLWPNGRATLLVRSDHADIIGHYGTVEATDKKARKFAKYDIFGSESHFGLAEFDEVWFRAFDHCMTAVQLAAPAPQLSRPKTS